MGAEIEPWTTYRMQGTLNFLQEVSRHTLELFPQLERARILRSWAGLCDLSPDYSPILGKTEVEGFHVSSGWGTYGFKAAPIVGKTLAELVATGAHAGADRAVQARALLRGQARVRAGRRGGEPLMGGEVPMKSSLEIAQEAELQPIDSIAERAGPAARRVRALRALQGEGVARRARPPARRAGRQARLRGRRDADQGGRGQDHHGGVAHPGPREDRQGAAAVPARAVARPGVRHQGRRRRRRHDPGGADGGPEPPLHRRHPRGRRGQQPARGAARRVDPARQPALDRRPAGGLEARARHERPRAAARSRSARAGARTATRASRASTSRRPPR